MFSWTVKISDLFNLFFVFFFPVLLFSTKIYSAWKTYFTLIFFFSLLLQMSLHIPFTSSLAVIYFHLLKTISLRTLEGLSFCLIKISSFRFRLYWVVCVYNRLEAMVRATDLFCLARKSNSSLHAYKVLECNMLIWDHVYCQY